jgi:hypothetical protein
MLDKGSISDKDLAIMPLFPGDDMFPHGRQVTYQERQKRRASQEDSLPTSMRNTERNTSSSFEKSVGAFQTRNTPVLSFSAYLRI